MQAGKIEGLPTTSSAAFASNKRQSNINQIEQKKDSNNKQSHSHQQITGGAGNQLQFKGAVADVMNKSSGNVNHK